MGYFLRWCLTALALLACVCASHANDYISGGGWVEDPQGRLSLEEITQLPESPLNHNLFGKGFSNAYYWIRLRIDPSQNPASKPDEKLVIKIRPSYQDQIWLYDPLTPEAKERVTGDYHDWENDEWHSLNLNFVVPVGAEPRDIWLRLHTHQVLNTSIEALSEKDAHAADRRQEALSIFYLALIGFILAWAVLTWIGQRDKLSGWFALRTLCASVFIFYLLGYGRMFTSPLLPEPHVDTMFNVSLWAFTAAAIWFDSNLVKEFQGNRWVVRILQSLVLAFPVEIIATLMDQIELAITINYVITFIGLTFVYWGVLSTQAWNNKTTGAVQPPIPKYVFVGLYTVATLAVLHNRFVLAGILPATVNLFDYILIYPLPISFFMMLLLQVRSYKMNQKKQAIQNALDITKREAELERGQRLEQERFLHMLTHELKTPISVAKINLNLSGIQGKEYDRIARALKNMTDVVERCSISSAVEENRLQAIPESFDVVAVIDQLLHQMGAENRVKFNEVNGLWAHTDCHLFTIIITNLVDNALKYSPQDSQVTIDCKALAHQGHSGISIQVANRLDSSNKPDPDRLFTKYYRAKSAESISGSGLGLYLSQGIAQLIGGVLQFKTADDHLVLELWLPA